jgi:hypothetical protein
MLSPEFAVSLTETGRWPVKTVATSLGDFSEQWAAGVHRSRAPIRMSVGTSGVLLRLCTEG